MSKIVLPPGKKPLATIRRVRDAADRVEDYGKLLEWLLVSNFPPPPSEKEHVFLGDYVQHYGFKFPALSDVNFALGVYNDIKHTNTKRGRPPEPDEIERAAKHLDRAILGLLLTLPWPVQRAVFVDPYVQLAKKIGIAAIVGLAIYGLLVIIVPALKKVPSSERQAALHELTSPKEIAAQRWNSVEQSARDTLASLDEWERVLSTWNQRWADLASNADGRRIAASSDATGVMAGLLEQKRPHSREVQALRADIDKALTPLREARTRNDFSQTGFGSELALFDRVRRRAMDETAVVKKALGTVDQLLAQTAKNHPAETSLQKAIEDRRESDRMAKAAAERRAAIAVAEARAARKALLSSRVAAYELELTKQRAEFQRLRALAADEQTKAKFEPFLAPGTRVPFRDHKGVRWRYESGRNPGPATPMKFAWLTQAHVLDSVEDMIAVGSHADNDRPKWTPPDSEEARREFGERFALLKQVAPIWHDMGLLGPPPQHPHFPDPDVFAEALKPFQGEWRDRKQDYDVLIVGDVGITTRSGNARNPVGGDMLRIEVVEGNSFRGMHHFQRGTWEPVTGQLLSPSRIRITDAGGNSWIDERIPDQE